MREDRLDDRTEDFDECCDGTDSCDCDECDALEEPEYCERICRLSPEGSSTVVELCRLCGAYLDDDLTIDPGICAECSEELDDADLGFGLPEEFDDDDNAHDFSEGDVGKPTPRKTTHPRGAGPMRDYDPMRHRELSGCAHSITETCDRYHCPTCGQPVVVATTGTTSVNVPLSAVEQAIDEGTQAALTPLMRGYRRPNANRD